MPSLTIMKGLPASGKSTAAEQIIRESGNTVRINKDLLRTMLHFDKFNGKNEGLTNDASRILAEEFLKRGVNVIIDDTNLNPDTFSRWKHLALSGDYSWKCIPMNTPWHECVNRDILRENKVGKHVIIEMALKYGLMEKPEKGFVLCDLDGTLCDVSHRLHHVKKDPKDWKAFFAGISEDKPRLDVFKMMHDYHKEGYPIIFVSARPETYRRETEKWLSENFYRYLDDFPGVTIIMRRTADTRPDTEVKAQMYETYFKDYPIHAVIDDRPSVIRMWREKGLHVIDVGAGIEF